MKIIYLKFRFRIKKLYDNFLKLFMLCCFLFLASCNDEKECGYNDCEEFCETFEDFESKKIGDAANWVGITTRNVEVISRGGSQVLFVEDGSGSTIAYNGVDFPKNLIIQGCALLFDIEYLSGSNNSNTTDNGIGIYDGATPTSSTYTAYFTLNASNLITSGNAPTNIEVPLELATNSALPSNSFGSWTISPSIDPATDATNFNNLIQNIRGVYFSIDEGGNPAEKWWFDNFCFKQCCPD